MLAAIASLAFAAPALAQYYEKPPYNPAYVDAAYEDEIIVIAPGVQRETTGRSASGARIQTLTTSLVVNTADLDLRYDADVDELHRRIGATAREACNELDRASRGVLLTSDRECVRDAIRDARLEADAMVYYARG
jgi:UrcA family protein